MGYNLFAQKVPRKSSTSGFGKLFLDILTKLFLCNCLGEESKFSILCACAVKTDDVLFTTHNIFSGRKFVTSVEEEVSL